MSKKTIEICDLCGKEVYACNSLIINDIKLIDGDQVDVAFNVTAIKNILREELDLCRECRDNKILQWAEEIKKLTSP